MRRLIYIFFTLLLTIEISAENADSVFQYIGNRGFNIEPQKVDMFDELPERIKEIASSFIINRFGVYSSSIKFVHAQIFPIDSAHTIDIKVLKERNTNINPIPHYDLNYSFEDSSLGICQYWINIGMDKLGQVIYCNFPYLENPRKQINSIQKTKEYSDSIMFKLYPEINRAEYKTYLIYNIDNDILIWQFCYLKNARENRKNYHCLLINAHYNDLIKELGWIEENHSIDYDCCDTGVQLYLNE